jgi:hypothetical protein
MASSIFALLIYCEEGSKSLQPGLLYRKQLKTVVEHFELKQLEKRDRVLTVHRMLTGTQRAKIEEAIA